MVQAKPALVEASALKPRCCSAFALPTSNGLGMMKQPLSCNFLNAARLSADVSMVAPQFVCFRRLHSNAASALPDAHAMTVRGKVRILGEDEIVLFGKA